MPELPEVETMCRGIRGIVGGRIKAVHFPRSARKPFAITPRKTTFRRMAVNCQAMSVDRLGKRVVIRLDSGMAIVFEPRMTGLVLTGDAPTGEHLRLVMELRGCSIERIHFWDRRGLGSVRLLSPSQLDDVLGPNQLGTDALDVSLEELTSRLGRSTRAIKVALLDQRAIAGIGNLYASEILHVAGVHPAKQCNRMTRAMWTRVHNAIGDVLNAAILHEGSTLSDGTYRNALNRNGSYQNYHRVYQRQGQRCRTCKRSRIRRIVQVQRSTFFCSHCQRQ